MEKILGLGEIDLLKDSSGNYYIKRKFDDVTFDLKNSWKSDKKNRFMTLSTRNHWMDIIKRYHGHKEDVKTFLEWYEKVSTEETNESKSNDITEGETYPMIDLEQTNELIKNLTEQIQQNNQFIQTNIIETLAEKMVSVKASDVADKITKSVDKYIEDNYGVLPTVYEFKLPDGKTTEATGIYHKELPNIMKFIEADIPLLLTGPGGSGKNYTLEKAAEHLGYDFYFTNAITQEYKLTGFIDANGVYQETQFYKAFKNGGVFFLDEMDASIPEALIILNAAIANKYFDFPNGRIEAHEKFRVVAAANTYGTGSDMIYVGRNVLDGATLDRFAVLEFDYDPRVEMSKCPNKSLYDFIVNVRQAVNEKHLRYVVSIRAMINAYKMLQVGFNKEYILKTAIFKSMTIDDIRNISGRLNQNNEWYNIMLKAYNI